MLSDKDEYLPIINFIIFSFYFWHHLSVTKFRQARFTM